MKRETAQGLVGVFEKMTHAENIAPVLDEILARCKVTYTSAERADAIEAVRKDFAELLNVSKPDPTDPRPEHIALGDTWSQAVLEAASRKAGVSDDLALEHDRIQVSGEAGRLLVDAAAIGRDAEGRAPARLEEKATPKPRVRGAK